MKTHFLFYALLIFASLSASAQTIKVLFTTDVHGALFPYNYVSGTESDNSMAKIFTFVDSVRTVDPNVILLDGGDMLQGSPVVYYYNNVDTASMNIVPRIYNYMKYDAVCIGNHDIEAGHKVYDKVVSQFEAPVLGANAVKSDGTPYFKPYTIVERAGKRIAVIGLVTPYIPHWLTENFWSGMEFTDMVESAKFWVKEVREKEKPDCIIGLFHSGFDYTYGGFDIDTYKNENASQIVALRVAGFDLVLCGHDHKLYNEVVTDPEGHKVHVLDAGTACRNIGQATITFNGNERPSCSCELISVKNKRPSEKYCQEFKVQQTAVYAYSKKVVGKLQNDIRTYESLFGPSALSEIVHSTMLKATGAQISITAPLLVNVTIPKGELTVGGMFNIYRYENILTTMSLTGLELKKLLEYSYDMWVSNPDKTGHILRLNKRNRLEHKYYNLDSAAGIRYTVDPYKPVGSRVEILSLEDGTPFDLNKTYSVAVNGYRANGGGGHFDEGVGLTMEQTKARITNYIEEDLRGLIMKELMKQGTIDIKPRNNWNFVPSDKVSKYIEADKKLFE
ncbi:MAG: bifunctional metallophosphatase/5'-nucleotidase [Bacteroidales bacterium]|jgi:2',3'-cyclic-nucleotide 2'-phosphodiesterase/3'-nucleotidase|nr:bifunctional metallophosphatase/5'-nucleotidase [Bacteroidales bacterium]